MRRLRFRAFFPFNGLGAGARGFVSATVRLLGCEARFECMGGVDLDANACADFEYLTGTKALPIDVMTIEHFWSPAMFRAAFGDEAPDVVFLSPPCKGASSLLSAAKAKTKEYRQLNRLAVVWLTSMLEAGWLPKLILLENVPNLPKRARAMLRSIRSLLRAAGYVFHASSHDCGEIGGLAQHRRRYLLVARRPSACPAILYQPTKKRVRGVGEVLSALPMPATAAAQAWGDLHEMPKISWRNWLRLALIPAGGDWRDLAGVLEGRARREVFRRHAVQAWDEPSPAVTGPGGHSVAAVADERVKESTWRGRYGVLRPDQPARTITAGDRPSKGKLAIADNRVQLAFGDAPGRHDLKHAVRGWDEPAKTIIGKTQPGSGAQAVADLRVKGAHPGAYGVEAWSDPATTVTGETCPSNGTRSVADPRALEVSSAFEAGYGVLRWDEPARTVAGTVATGTGAYSIADARERGFLENVRMLSLDEAMELDLDPDKTPPFTPVIIAEDATWHRPMTLLELAALQGLPAHVNGAPLRLHGTRGERAEHIGNAVPEGAAKEIATSMLVALVEGALGTMSLSGGGDVWVAPTNETAVTAAE